MSGNYRSPPKVVFELNIWPGQAGQYSVDFMRVFSTQFGNLWSLQGYTLEPCNTVDCFVDCFVDHVDFTVNLDLTMFYAVHGIDQPLCDLHSHGIYQAG